MITTTLNRIQSHKPCKPGWRKLLAGLGKTCADDAPLPYSKILRINGLDDALWATRCEPQHERVWRLLAVQFARNVLPHLTWQNATLPDWQQTPNLLRQGLRQGLRHWLRHGLRQRLRHGNSNPRNSSQQ